MSNKKIAPPARGGPAAGRREGTSESSKKKIAQAAAALGLIGLVTVAFAYFRGDPAVAEAKALAASLKTAKDDQRKDQWQKLRTSLDKLSPDQRRQVMDDMRKGFEERQREEMRRYFAMSPKDRNAYLAKVVKDQEKRRKEWAAKAQSKSDAQSKSGANAANKNQNGNNNNNNNNGRRQPLTQEQRDQLRKQRLDNTTPQDRSQRAEFRRQMNIFRQQNGLPPGGGRWGR